MKITYGLILLFVPVLPKAIGLESAGFTVTISLQSAASGNVYSGQFIALHSFSVQYLKLAALAYLSTMSQHFVPFALLRRA